MRTPENRFAIILFVAILLPSIMYSAYEFTKLNQNEEQILQIYNSQLEAVLFSINQYSEDVLTSWAVKLRNALSSGRTDEVNVTLNDFLKDKPPVKYISIISGTSNYIYPPSRSDSLYRLVDSVIQLRRPKLDRLKVFLKQGYSKLEPFYVPLDTPLVSLYFVPDTLNGSNLLYGILIQPENFVRDILKNKVQQVAGNDFTIPVINGVRDSIIAGPDSLLASQFTIRKELWFLPGYYIGISPKGKTIDELVYERAWRSYALIFILNLVIIVGVWVVFKNIKKAFELVRLKSDFVSNVSHELRTPLALISMFSETLELGRVRSDSRREEYYKIISQEAQRLSKIVNRLLNFSQTEAGKRKYHFDYVDVNDVCAKVYETYKFHLEHNGFKFSYFEGKDIPVIIADYEALSETVINLIDNAAKYSRDKKNIELHTGYSESGVFIEVRDQGIGIKEKHQKKIFEKFYRENTGPVHNTKGAGLGLSLVKHIMEDHKGKIELFSTYGRGSMFRLLFPLKANQKLQQSLNNGIENDKDINS
ncbi:MAG: HAMP domain-containing histidine kinase [Ignavibacteria bacterium]|nr:HAMP domain-containing histidine kinase [Ignavibacteria bacterium]MCA0388752.1 HAMP domain-containing histidine kinase [Bacteroidota bacterium]